MGKPKVLELTEAQHLELDRGFRLGEKHCFRMRCRTVLLKAEGLSAVKAGVQTEMSFVVRERMGEAIQRRGYRWPQDTFRTWQETHHGLLGRGSCPSCHRAGQAMCEQSQGSM